VKVESGVLTKVIRVIANLSMNEQVGLNLCDNRKCIDLLIQIISECIGVYRMFIDLLTRNCRMFIDLP